MSPQRTDIHSQLADRILVLDGAMGTMVQSYDLEEPDFRADRFADHPGDLKGCNDLLVLTQPKVVEEIHTAFLDAGADIIETNTFNATSISMADYQLEPVVREMNTAAALIARRAADAAAARKPDRPRYVAGAVGPTSSTLSLSPDVNDPGYRTHTFDQIVASYAEQVHGLMDGAVDLLLCETVFDTLTLKAALYAVEQVFADRDQRIPLMISVTITDQSGRTLSGQTVEAFWQSVSHVDALSVGINCALGATEMRPYVESLSDCATTLVSCYPNAGLPNEFGEYDDTPVHMAELLRDFAESGWLNVVGGCCGTTPAHIREIAAAMEDVRPRVPVERSPLSVYSGLEPLTLHPETSFVMIGERTNVTGSKRFERLVKNGDYEAALDVARKQVEGGANIIDVNMDEGLLDSEAAMTVFLKLIGSEPDISRVPVMVDSSDFKVIEAGLKCLQGKGIVNSISLKEGEDAFREHARTVARYGAAVVVMAFDEEGQATSADRKVAICERAYRILTEEIGMHPTDIIFDPNILTVATGMPEHNDYAVNFIEATRLIKERMPLVKVSGGVSNISFSFRGNDRVREAIHAAFLYHAIKAGLDMGIVNAGQLMLYEDIPQDLLGLIEDVLFNRTEDATERLVEFAEGVRTGGTVRKEDDAWRAGSLEERLMFALRHGKSDYVDTDIQEALEKYDRPLDIIEGPLMQAMNVVGDLFGEGKMFLPQVVKTARVMKQAVAILEPLMAKEAADSGTGRKRGKILLATVKGDVHDIGKNIVGVVLGCNNYDVIDLGVMVPAEKILKTAREEQVDMIGLSGLITPSLHEMVHVAKEMEREGFELPLLIGGATTSRKHTSVKIAPAYSHPTIHVKDASIAAGVVGNLKSDRTRESFGNKNREMQEREQADFARGDTRRPLIGYEEACDKRARLDFTPETSPEPEFLGTRVREDIGVAEVEPYIDWGPFFHAWELRGSYPSLLTDPVKGEEAKKLFADAREMIEKAKTHGWLSLSAVYGFFPAASKGDDIVLYTDVARTEEAARIHTLRQQQEKRSGGPYYALADFLAPAERGVSDHLGGFAVTAGEGVDRQAAVFRADNDDYSAILLQALGDRFAEALAEMTHQSARCAWGFGIDENLRPEELVREKYRGIRPAPGYPACPDHTEKRTLFSLLDAEKEIGMKLTENFAMTPAASVSGLYFAHPESRDFAVGKIGRDQVTAYASRKGMPRSDVERWLAANLD